jgi:hypothetical protein
MNKIEVTFDVDPGGKGQATIKEIDDKIKSVGQGGSARDVWTDLISGARRAEDKIDDIDKAIEESFVKSKASAAGITDTFVRGLTSAQRQALSLQQSTKNLGTDGARISAQAAQIQAQFGRLYQQLATGKPLSELNKELDAARLKLERLNQQSLTLRSQRIAVSSESGASGSRVPGLASGASGSRVPGLASAASFAGSQLGLPGLGTLTSSIGIGGAAAGVGIGIAAFAGIRELVKLSSEAEQAQLSLARAAHSTGRTFEESSLTAESFRREMVANRDEAAKLAAAFGELQLRSGEGVHLGDVSKYATLGNAQGLSAEQLAKDLKGIARGSKESFEELTGLDADLVLDRYAKSINRTTGELTDMERVLGLTSAVQERANELVNLGAQGVQTLDSKWQSLKNTLGELVSGVGPQLVTHLTYSFDQINSLLTGGSLGAGPQATYEREVAKYDQESIAWNQRQALASKTKAGIAERGRQQTSARDRRDFFSDFDRQSRAKPEDYQVGLSPAARLQQDISELRDQRAQLEKALSEFQKRRAEYSSDDAKSIEGTFKDRIQATIDQTRGNLQSLAADTAAAAKKAADEAIAAQKKVADEAQASIGSLFDFLKSHAGKDNPYVGIFSEASQAAESFQKTSEALRAQFGAAADDVISKLESLTKAKQAALAEDTVNQRFSDRLDAQGYRDEAQSLRSPAPATAERAKQEAGEFRPRSAQAALQRLRSAEADTQSISRDGFSSRFAFMGKDSPFAPRAAATEQDKKLRAFVAAKDAGTVFGDPLGLFSPRATAKAASQDVTRARNALRLIRETEAQAVASGEVDAATARKLADEQILSRVKGRVSDADLRATPDLREAVAGALDRKASRLDSRESDAKKEVAEQAAELKELREAIKALVKNGRLLVDAGPAAQINITSKDVTASTASRAPAMLPGS